MYRSYRNLVFYLNFGLNSPCRPVDTATSSGRGCCTQGLSPRHFVVDICILDRCHSGIHNAFKSVDITAALSRAPCPTLAALI